MNPAGSPVYVTSGAELEWNACVIVTWTPATSIVPPLLKPISLSSGHALPVEPRDELDDPEQRAAEPLVQRRRVGAVVAVAVREGDRVGALRLLLAVGAGRPGEERVDVDPAASVGVEAKRGVAEPGER